MKYRVVASCGVGRGERGEGKGVAVREVTHSGIKQDYGMVVRRPQLSLFQKINSEH